MDKETLVCKADNPVSISLQNFDNVMVDQIYRDCFPSVKFMIISNSGSEDDAQDIFHDALMILMQKAGNTDFELKCSLKTYIFSVCFNLWQRELYKRLKETDLPDHLELYDDTDYDQMIRENKLFEIFRINFEMLQPEYQKVLNMYLSRCSMRRITSEMGYASEKYAKVKKYMCKEHLKKAIHSDPRFKELSYMNSN
jgi:RNA polymerase sigma factor (sigma-70 family)